MKKFSTSVLMRRLNRFEAAVRNHEMRGAMHPDDREDIERDFEKSKKRLIEYYVQLMQHNEELRG